MEPNRRASSVYLADPPLPAVFSRAQARAAGLTDRQISRRLTLGLWTVQHRGMLSSTPAAPAPARRAAQLRIVASAGSVRGRDVVVSHGSAACVHGLPAPLGGWPEPTMTSSTGRPRRRGGVHVLVAPLSQDDVHLAGRLPVTGLARTAVDCLRTLPGPDSLAIVDAALGAGLPMADLLSEVARQAGWPGIVRARELTGLADGRRESPLESWSALAFHRGGVPRPEWQIDIHSTSGVFCGRVDSWWSEGLAGEADGRAKYALAAAQREGGQLQQLLGVLDAERGREAAIRRTGAELTRWGAGDVLRADKAELLCAHLLRRLRQVRATRSFIGVAEPAVIRTQ